MELNRFEAMETLRPLWTGIAGWPCFLPDGETILFTGHIQQQASSLMTISLRAKAEVKVLTVPEMGARRSTLHPDGNKIAFNLNNATVWTFDLNSSVVEPYAPEWHTEAERFIHPYYHPDGKSIVLVSDSDGPTGREGVVCSLSPEDGVTEWTQFPEVCAGNLTVSPDGKSVVFAGNAGVFHQDMNQLWIVTPPAPAKRLEPGSPTLFQGRAPRWSPDGKWIAFVSTRPAPDAEDEDPKAVWIVDANGQNAYQLTPTAFRFPYVGWSPDQRSMAICTDDYLGVMELPARFHVSVLSPSLS